MVQKDMQLKPRKISVCLHSPTEPADMRSRSFQIPLGQSTTVYITPKARIIDDTALQLSESERHCRDAEDTKTLDIFNSYSRVGCLFECKMKHALKRCKCQPWHYPFNEKDLVRQTISRIF